MAQAPRFYVGDKVTHKELPCPVAEVTGYSQLIDYPGKGLTRKVHWIGLNPLDPAGEGWTWEFLLEAW